MFHLNQFVKTSAKGGKFSAEVFQQMNRERTSNLGGIAQQKFQNKILHQQKKYPLIRFTYVNPVLNPLNPINRLVPNFKTM